MVYVTDAAFKQVQKDVSVWGWVYSSQKETPNGKDGKDNIHTEAEKTNKSEVSNGLAEEIDGDKLADVVWDSADPFNRTYMEVKKAIEKPYPNRKDAKINEEGYLLEIKKICRLW